MPLKLLSIKEILCDPNCRISAQKLFLHQTIWLFDIYCLLLPVKIVTVYHALRGKKSTHHLSISNCIVWSELLRFLSLIAKEDGCFHISLRNMIEYLLVFAGSLSFLLSEKCSMPVILISFGSFLPDLSFVCEGNSSFTCHTHSTH